MKNGFFQSNGEFSTKNSSQQDCYFKNMNEFVDDKLEMVVEKLAEKKSLKTVNNTLRWAIDKLDQETDVLLKENHKLGEEYDKAFDINKAKNNECDDLLDSLTDLREKIESYRISENAHINALREDESELRAQLQYNKQQLNLEKNLWQDELKAQKQFIQDLDEENRLSQISLKDYHGKYKYCVKLEKEKAEVFKEKNKILTQLMNDERPVLKANTNKRVFDITKNFCKKLDQRKISQAIDTTRGIIDLSSTKLFNTTLNTLKLGGFDKTYESKEKGGKTSKSKRQSLDAFHNVSHNSSRIYE